MQFSASEDSHSQPLSITYTMFKIYIYIQDIETKLDGLLSEITTTVRTIREPAQRRNLPEINPSFLM